MFSFFSSNYGKGAIILSHDDMSDYPAIQKYDGTLTFEIDFDHSLALTEKNLKALVFKYHDNSYISYGSNSKDFPLCMDFAELAAADVRKGAILQSLEERPCFGVAELTKQNGSRHAINFAFTAEGKMLFYEPQDGKWFPETGPDYLASLDTMYI